MYYYYVGIYFSSKPNFMRSVSVNYVKLKFACHINITTVNRWYADIVLKLWRASGKFDSQFQNYYSISVENMIVLKLTIHSRFPTFCCNNSFRCMVYLILSTVNKLTNANAKMFENCWTLIFRDLTV